MWSRTKLFPISARSSLTRFLVSLDPNQVCCKRERVLEDINISTVSQLEEKAWSLLYVVREASSSIEHTIRQSFLFWERRRESRTGPEGDWKGKEIDGHSSSLYPTLLGQASDSFYLSSLGNDNVLIFPLTNKCCFFFFSETWVSKLVFANRKKPWIRSCVLVFVSRIPCFLSL
jgi:hypothetical protein